MASLPRSRRSWPPWEDSRYDGRPAPSTAFRPAPRMGPVTALFLVAAGVLAGVVGTGGGITSLVSYPALLAVGLSPLNADVANLVALVACWPGSALSSRRELAGSGRWLARGLPLAALGAAAGAILLLTTQSGVFERLVPILLAAGSLAQLLQPVLTRRA